MRTTAVLLAALGMMLAGSATAQSGDALLESKGCLGCHGVDEAKMGPALRQAAAKYRGAEAKLAAALRAGKGHPMPVDASEAELEAMLAFLQKPAAGAAASPVKAAAAPAIDKEVCLGCHGQQGFTPHVSGDMFDKSVHAQRQCTDCHTNITAIPHEKAAAGAAPWRVSVPNVCGSCHTSQRAQYATSVHGKEVLEKGNAAAAVCSDCHTTHSIARPELESTKLAIVKNCGGCHAESFRTYTETYHGKVHQLGYAYTAKCYDCHAWHTVQRVSDPSSTVHPDNRLDTCRTCHENATAGFVTFQPHATTHDFERYPHMWIAAKSMIALLVGVFVFFWTHTALWFYREWRDRKEGKSRPHVEGVALEAGGRQFQRFGPVWRLAHLVFALSVMALVLTGMAVFFAETEWARTVVSMFGSPKVAALVHRGAAAIMLGIFFLHLVYVVGARILPRLRTFQWFGPNSLVPNWQDLKDIIAMFQWFFGRRPRPQFDRWTYWEKFDYWAVFWGMAIIGGSGFMLAFPDLIASLLPGWVFNVAAIVHGEEAVLAAVFLFTVHFFNNHFRPDKFPLDTVMFTGAVPLEEFRREHAVEYRRLKDSGELERHLVDAPSRPMRIGSTILGFTLIAIGLALLALVVRGFLGRI